MADHQRRIFLGDGALLLHQGHQIPQNADLDDADESAALVALQFGIVAADLHHDTAATIHASGFMGNDREVCFDSKGSRSAAEQRRSSGGMPPNEDPPYYPHVRVPQLL